MSRYSQSFWNGLQGYGFSIVVVVLPVLSLVGQEQFSILLTCLAVLLLATRYSPPVRAVAPVLAPILALILWGAVTALWSLDPGHSLVRAARITAWLIVGVIVLCWAREVRVHRPALLLGAVVLAHAFTVGYLVIEGMTDYHVGRQLAGAQITLKAVWLVYKAGASFLLLMTVPLGCACLIVVPRLAAVPLALAGYLLFDPSVSYSAKLAFAAAVPIGLLTLSFGRNFTWVTATLFGVFTLAAPWLLNSENVAFIADFYSNAPHSALHRFAIWDFTIDRIGDRSWLGWGIDAGRYITGGKEIIRSDVLPEALTSLDQWHDVKESGYAMFLPLHPHNAALQIRLELGLPGAILAAITVVAMVRQAVPAEGRKEMSAILASFTTLFLYGQLSTSVWHSWWISGQILLMAILFATLPAPRRKV